MKVKNDIAIASISISFLISFLFSFSLIIYENSFLKQILFFLIYVSFLIPIFYIFFNRLTEASLARFMGITIVSIISYILILNATYFSFWPLFKMIHSEYGVNAFAWDGHLIRLMYATPFYILTAIFTSLLTDQLSGKVNKVRQLGANWLSLIFIIFLLFR
jgi:hypothetical protein